MTKSRKAAEASNEPQQFGAAADEMIEHAKTTLGGEVVNEPSPFSAEPPAETGTAHAAQVQKKPFQPVRGWTTRNKQPVQYRKLADADLGIILFKFVLPEGQNTLAPDVKDILDAHKRYPESGEPTGLHFENSGKHGKIWLLRNTTEGRAIADKIDLALQKLAAKHDLQEQQSAGR
jgi:hypothetical protein